jgi:hypothetical protein
MCFMKKKIVSIDASNSRTNDTNLHKKKKKSKIRIHSKASIKENQKKISLETEDSIKLDEDFIKECITCNYCKSTYSIRDNKIKMYCLSCERYYCCNVAGECVGKNCKVMIDKKIVYARYCKSCVTTIIEEGKKCLCINCYNLSN